MAYFDEQKNIWLSGHMVLEKQKFTMFMYHRVILQLFHLKIIFSPVIYILQHQSVTHASGLKLPTKRQHFQLSNKQEL